MNMCYELTMKKLILIDRLAQGNMTIAAYVVEDSNEKPSFAIYLDQFKQPMILFKRLEGTKQIQITINSEQVEYMRKNRTPDIKIRRVFYKFFIDFVTQAEIKAKHTFFKDIDMQYLKDVEQLKYFKARYINE